ncbi:multi-functional enzyme with acyl-CoA-reductase activity domain protein [Mycobacterium kansasii]|uniref:Multi-functional enzyme with acyl-CoA-reductase activity domain protein n=1 Tax=Mycobacterium kansasii TaxID=1768 RepID=A0A1V3X0U9_MYCKA|nr:multi-functional enzyme with acyl-CoA-reductase activity domain protein [Mycobacterium kansasii]
MTRVNVVPRDFVVDAVSYLSGLAISEGRTYHLADPQPLTVEEMTDVLARVTGRQLVKIPLPRKLAKGSLAHVPGLYRLLRIPPEAVDYFAHPTFYLTDHCRADLADGPVGPRRSPATSTGSWISCAATRKSALRRCSDGAAPPVRALE